MQALELFKKNSRNRDLVNEITDLAQDPNLQEPIRILLETCYDESLGLYDYNLMEEGLDVLFDMLSEDTPSEAQIYCLDTYKKNNPDRTAYVQKYGHRAYRR